MLDLRPLCQKKKRLEESSFFDLLPQPKEARETVDDHYLVLQLN